MYLTKTYNFSWGYRRHEYNATVSNHSFKSIDFNYFVTDEREDVQKKTFAKWINSQLLKVRLNEVSQVPLSSLA